MINIKYTLRGYLFDKQTKEPLPIMPGIVVANEEEAHELIKGVGYKYYIFTLDKIPEKEE